jgi:hypothetical protein
MVLVAARAASAQPARSPDDTAYLALVERFKSGAAYAAVLKKEPGRAPQAEGLALRMAYTKTSFYKPYSDPSVEPFRAAVNHHKAGRFAECLASAEQAITTNYTNLHAHLYAGSCAASAGIADKTERYARSFGLLYASIAQDPGRDGKTPDTAFRVISIGEQYAVMDFLRLRSVSKALVGASGPAVDCHRVQGAPDTPESQLCFDVTVPMSVLSKELNLPAGRTKP